MSLRSTAAHSSRVKKPKPPTFKRSSSSSSPYASLPRRKPSSQGSKTKPDPTQDEDLLDDDRLPDAGLVLALATDLTLRDVPQTMQYIHAHMFTPLPTHHSGLSSTLTAQILNYRAALPPLVTISHTQALLNSPTTVEREIAELSRHGTIRKIFVPGRGGIGEALILVRDLERLIGESAALEQRVKDTFINLLRANPTALTLPRDVLSATDAKTLTLAGFLTAAQASWTTTDVFSRPGSGDGRRGTLTSLHNVARAASGSLAAVGGPGAVHSAGGSGGGTGTSSVSATAQPHLALSIPSLGTYLKLLTAARAHLVSLLAKSRFREMPWGLLKERWEGGAVAVAGGDKASEARRTRGEFDGVALGRTRKWRLFYGVAFEFVVEECVGMGTVEVFETGCVGRGVRAL